MNRLIVGVFVCALATVAVLAYPHHDHDHDHDHHHHHDHDDYKVKTHEDLTHYREHCAAKLNVAADFVEKYKKWEYPDDEKTHCYMKCVFEQFGFFDETHGFDVHKIHHQLAADGSDGHVDHSDALHGKIASCAEKHADVGDNACKWAYQGGMCFIRQNLPLVQHSVKTH